MTTFVAIDSCNVVWSRSRKRIIHPVLLIKMLPVMSSLKIVYTFSNMLLFFYLLFLLPHFLLSAAFNNNRLGEEPPETPLYNRIVDTFSH